MSQRHTALFGALAAGLILNTHTAQAAPAADICSKAEVIDGRLYLTCDFAEAMDGQEICSSTDRLSSDPQTRKNQLSTALAKALAHRALQHHDCQFQYGRMLPNPARILGKDWNHSTHCSLITLRNRCKEELGL